MGNLLNNPGFETGNLSGWNCSPADRITTAAHSGRFALAAAATNYDNAQCTQTIAVQPHHAYTLSAWLQGQYAFVGVTGTGTNDARTFTPLSSTYTQLKVPFTTGTSTTSVTVFVHGWYVQGTILADDLSVS